MGETYISSFVPPSSLHVEQCHLGGKCARFFALTIRVPSSLAGPTDLIVFTPTGIGTFTRIKEIALFKRPFLDSKYRTAFVPTNRSHFLEMLNSFAMHSNLNKTHYDRYQTRNTICLLASFAVFFTSFILLQ